MFFSCSDISLGERRLPNITQELNIVLKYPYVENIALSFGDSNVTCIELCQSIDTNFSA